MELEPVRDSSLSAQSFEVLKSAIFSGKLKPGEVLREMSLARALNVSQSTVREALFHLEQMGLVVRMPNKGTRVKTLSREEFVNRFSIRIRLEEMAMIEAAARMTDEDFEELGRLAMETEREVLRNDYQKSGQADLRFHQYIWRRSGNPELFRILEELTAPLFVFSLQAYQQTRRSLAASARSHHDIVAALRTKDPDAIRDAIQKHTSAHYQRFLEAEAASLKRDADASANAPDGGMSRAKGGRLSVDDVQV
ncbi:MAG TPA: GntR family transcriptional regulator [Acidobacteriota bacterium]|nr:GntR family transcriptional regulator [Acidobacteriota bacterium]